MTQFHYLWLFTPQHGWTEGVHYLVFLDNRFLTLFLLLFTIDMVSSIVTVTLLCRDFFFFTEQEVFRVWEENGVFLAGEGVGACRRFSPSDYWNSLVHGWSFWKSAVSKLNVTNQCDKVTHSRPWRSTKIIHSKSVLFFLFYFFNELFTKYYKRWTRLIEKMNHLKSHI